ncbi:MAG TPA: hypothetical protein VL132_21135 [Planctomycetaceae bacterium]|nr:hypothetical protein [Planctomycetaceae bacterium]
MTQTFAFTVPRRANAAGRYVSQCFRNGKKWPAGNVDCGTDKTAARQRVVELTKAEDERRAGN